ALEGPDALAFAQAQFMNDVSALGDGQWQWNGWLTPKGRVIALFALLRLDARTLWLLLPDVGAAELAPLLQRFVFRSKVALSVPSVAVNGGFHPPNAASGASFAVIADNQIELDMSGGGGARTVRIAASAAPGDASAVSHWAAFDMAHGLPRLPPSQSELWTPQQLSLDRLHAFSVKKGCYPGQEIVARTHFLGQAKRGLVALCASAPIPIGADVELDGTAIGKIVSASPAEPCFALAVLPVQRGTGGLSAAGLGLNDIGLREGLVR
ncbi:MAG: folate-binding protein, partial [Thermomonas sp.]